MQVHMLVILLVCGALAVLAVACAHLRFKVLLLREKLDDSMHKRAEIGNFLSLFSQNIKTMEEIENWMNVTARYVADLVEAQAVCVFALEGESLKAVGICGAFPPLHKAGSYVLTKPRYILESLKRDRIKLGEGIIGEVAERREDVFLDDASRDPRLSEAESIVPITSLMAVPLVDDGRVTGVMCAVNSRRADQPFSQEQFGRFKFIAAQVVLAQNIIQIYSNLSEQQRINQELEFARSLQSSLLPKSFPVWGQFVVQAFTRASKEVSGDFYDFVEIDDDRLLVVIGDACGKGIPACMIMSMTRSFIRSNAERFVSLKDLLRELNENLFRDTGDERYITLACCLLDKKESTIEYARAGHTELLVYVRNHIRTINPEGSALGLLPSELSDFDTLCIGFSPDMSLLLFTDGITEATNPGGEYYALDRLKDVYRNACAQGSSPELAIDSIMESVDAFSESPDSQADDQTMVIIRHA